jgi:arsenate reductase
MYFHPLDNAMRLYHNPRCSKSRQALALLDTREIEYEDYRYLVEGLSKSDIVGLIERYDGQPANLVRTGEDEYKTSPINLESVDDIVALLMTSPRCLQRPILDDGERAIIGRPPEDILTLLP